MLDLLLPLFSLAGITVGVYPLNLVFSKFHLWILFKVASTSTLCAFALTISFLLFLYLFLSADGVFWRKDYNGIRRWIQSCLFSKFSSCMCWGFARRQAYCWIFRGLSIRVNMACNTSSKYTFLSIFYFRLSISPLGSLYNYLCIIMALPASCLANSLIFFVSGSPRIECILANSCRWITKEANQL